MLRLALPKGRLMKETLELLKRCGLIFQFKSDRDYSPVANDPEIWAKVLKVRAIPQLIALGNFQAGFCGHDLLAETGYEEVLPVLDLGLNRVKLVVAVPRGQENILIDPPKRPLVIATEYEQIASRWAMKHGLSHIIIQTWGSTEGYAPDDADIVFDNVETGRTMAANGLAVIEEIMESSTVLAVNASDFKKSAIYEKISELALKIQGRRKEFKHV